uniref:Protein kinase domain-containing protein n=1 Tax=Macrostomum lignano TaxID=282301 RepID=A0A1I8J7A8_9PLAT
MDFVRAIRDKLKGGKRHDGIHCKTEGPRRFRRLRSQSSTGSTDARKIFEAAANSSSGVVIAEISGDSTSSTIPQDRKLDLTACVSDREQGGITGPKHTQRCFEIIYCMLFSRSSADHLLRPALTSAIVDLLLRQQVSLPEMVTSVEAAGDLTGSQLKAANEVYNVESLEKRTPSSMTQLTIYSGMINTCCHQLSSNINNSTNNAPQELPTSITTSNLATTTVTEYDRLEFEIRQGRPYRRSDVGCQRHCQPSAAAAGSATTMTATRTVTVTPTSSTSAASVSSASESESCSLTSAGSQLSDSCRPRSCSTEQQSQSNRRRADSGTSFRMRDDEDYDEAAAGSDGENRRRRQKSKTRRSSSQHLRRQQQKERRRRAGRESRLSHGSRVSRQTFMEDEDDGAGSPTSRDDRRGSRDLLRRQSELSMPRASEPVGSRDSSLRRRRDSRPNAGRKSRHRSSRRNSDRDSPSETGSLSPAREETGVMPAQSYQQPPMQQPPPDQYAYPNQQQMPQQQQVPLPRAWRAFSESSSGSSDEEEEEECHLCELADMRGAVWRMSGAAMVDPYQQGSIQRTMAPVPPPPAKKRRRRHRKRQSKAG